MAQALECPACGMRHRLDGLVPDSTFRCERCAQKLLVPATIPAATSATRSTTATTVAPPPRRRAPGAPATALSPAGGSAAGVTVTLPAVGAEPPRVPPDGARARGPEPGRRKAVAWYWRLVAWVVAIPLGFVIAAWPSYRFGLISKDDVLDVFVGSGVDRYARLGLVTVIWDVATALLVQLFVEGGRWWAARRRHMRPSTGRDRPDDSPVPVVSS
ncbi:MAG: hypothetical protein WEB19_00140 [Acidimicrobiia bacterium]